LDSVQEAGLDGIEVTFAPGDWTSALVAYGSAEGFAKEVAAHNLEVCSGFFSSRVPGTDRRLDLASADDRSEYVELADRYAEFLGACGANVLITALGLRKTKLARPTTCAIDCGNTQPDRCRHRPAWRETGPAPGGVHGLPG
jgi:sugar phosphate isomerase/epimerase